jgi:hypothetical protein
MKASVTCSEGDKAEALISLPALKANILRFLERCGVAEGVANEAAWNAAGVLKVFGAEAERFIRPAAERREAPVSIAERLRVNHWAFASTPGGVESLEGGHSAVEALFLLGELGRLSNENKRAWVHYFNQYQDRETGYYLGPYVPPRDHPSWRDGRVCTHPWSHMHDHLISSLCPTLMLLGGTSRFPLSQGSMTGRFLDRSYLEHYLHGRDWNDYRGDLDFRRHNPWWMGNEFWYPACILWQIATWEAGTPEARQARRLLDDVWYAWHDRNFAVDGFWHGDLDGDPARLWQGCLPSGNLPVTASAPDQLRRSAIAIMGGAHQLWVYDFDGHPIPEAVRRAQTDAVLAIQNRHHRHFGLGDVENPHGWSNNCTDVDGMTVLAINHHRQDYRRADIAVALRRAMQAILTDKINADGVLQSIPGAPFAHNFNSWATYSPGNQGNLLDQSFYLWAVVAACSVVRDAEEPVLRSFLEQAWPRVPSHWLWVPKEA